MQIIWTSLTPDITTPASHHLIFYRTDALPDAKPTVSKHWRQPWYNYTVKWKTQTITSQSNSCVLLLDYKEWRYWLANLIRPGASDPGKLVNAATQFDILVACYKMPQTVVDVRSYADQCVSVENHARSAHTEVLLILETQLSHFVLGAEAGLQPSTTQTT